MSQTIRSKRVKTALVVLSVFAGMAGHAVGSGTLGQGYFFKTPEAYLNPDEFRWNDRSRTSGDRLFRAMKYMRPGAVWAVYEALQKAEGNR